MTTMNNNHENTFTFRSKFENRLVTDAKRPVFMDSFEAFCNLASDTARKILWRLTYNDDEFLEKNLHELGLTLEIVPLDKVLTLRDELRYQYELLYPDFLAIEVPDECLEAFTALKNHTDSIVANVVYGYCFSNSYLDNLSMSQILDLLGSNKENRYFGGLRSLGFSYKEANYLKQYHLLIRNLLKALYERNPQNIHFFKNTPFDGLDNCLKDAGIDLPFDIEDIPAKAPTKISVETSSEVQDNEHPAEADSGFKPLTVQAILEHKDVFTSFVESSDMNILLQVGKLGFDLNKVIAKKEAILEVIEANTKKEMLDKLIQEAESFKEIVEFLMIEATKKLNN